METNQLISDKFIKDFFDNIPIQQCNKLAEGMCCSFMKHTKDGKVIGEDYDDVEEIFKEALSLVSENLYDVSESGVFPKAIKFAYSYMGVQENIPIIHVIGFYLSKRIGKEISPASYMKPDGKFYPKNYFKI